MFVGHGLLAFAIVAFAATRLEVERATVLRVAALAALFATLPDLDIVYGLTGLFENSAALVPVDSFWAAGNRIHRGVTHALPVGAVTAMAVGLLARRDRRFRALGVSVLVALVAFVFAYSGALAGAVTLLLALGAVGLVAAASRYDLSPTAVAGAALVGLLSHPFGDLLTGEPPALLYPVDVTLVAERVTLSTDPTLHLLGAFGVELATVWLALGAYFWVTGRRPHSHVDRRAVVGVGYAGAALALPAPTLDVAYPFVFSVLAVGMVGAAPPPLSRVRSARAVVTGTAAVSLAAVAYALVYLFV